MATSETTEETAPETARAEGDAPANATEPGETTARTPGNWQQVLREGDRDEFEALVRPHLEDLLQACRQELEFYAEHDRIHGDDFTEEEIAGETLIQAWEHRLQRPEQMTLRGWLLGTQHRILRKLVQDEEDYRHSKAISFDDELPKPQAGEDARERFSDLYQSDEPNTWEDVTPGQTPVDYEIDMDEERPTSSPSIGRHVVMMHDEFEMSLPEVAFTMQMGVREMAKHLESARTTGFERGEETPAEPTDEPAPPKDE